MPSEETRESLLDAAKRVMRRDGAGHLTLDAVAREAGVSKGGLLYHFPSKSDLLRSMIAHGMRQAEEEKTRALGPNPPRGAFARHVVMGTSMAACDDEASPCPSREMVWSMLGAAANDPSLLQPGREMHERWQRRLEDETGDPDVATIFHLVGHGLWSAELFGFDVPDAAQRERITNRLCQMAGLENMEEN